jgi:hypothetical protein
LFSGPDNNILFGTIPRDNQLCIRHIYSCFSKARPGAGCNTRCPRFAEWINVCNTNKSKNTSTALYGEKEDILRRKTKKVDKEHMHLAFQVLNIIGYVEEVY